MADQKQTENNSSPQPERKKEIRKEAAAQRDLMGSAAVDPQPLLNEEEDPIVQHVKQSSESE